MSIEVTLGEEKKENGYPKLMKGGGDIVLFSAERCGALIKNVDGERDYDDGEYRTDWIMTCFLDYNLPITLKNGG